MPLVVYKFGGTSLSTPARIRNAAKRLRLAFQSGTTVVAVVSAMGNTTDRLLRLARQVGAAEPSPREQDMLVANGESISAPLLAMALHVQGMPAVSLSGLQAGIVTSRSHSRAKIRRVSPARIQAALKHGQVPVVAGFQGVTEDLDVTTLGRGGSDTTAVALAAALQADWCEILTDVDGIYTADPRLVPQARLLDSITYEEMLELASVGAKVMHPRAVELGGLYSIPIKVRSSFNNRPGTIICATANMEEGKKVTSVACDDSVSKITVNGVPDRPGIAAALFAPLGQAGISVDVILQNISHAGHTDVSFTVPRGDGDLALSLVKKVADAIGAADAVLDPDVCKVSIVGTGMLGSPGIAATMFGALAARQINIEMISTSEIRITCIVHRRHLADSVRTLHETFELGNVAARADGLG